MIRTSISLEPDDKRWLDRVAEAEQTSMAEVVRRAVRLMRASAPPLDASFQDLLQATSGTWGEGDGLAYQNKTRAEWDGR